MELNIKGKNAVVTGGASGLGAEISRILASEGANVAINYIVEPEVAQNFANVLSKEYNVKCIAVKGDVSNPDDVKRNFDEIVSELGGVDILVNNAGVWPTAYVEDMTDEEWERTIRINLNGPFYWSRNVANHLIDRKSKGKIINIVSQAAFHGSTSGHAHYAASKGGLVTFTVSLAREVAKYGINVCAVAPGMMRTAMNKDALSKREDKYLERIPLGRISDPVEVAYVVAFLASDKADYITGATIDVTGGMLMR